MPGPDTKAVTPGAHLNCIEFNSWCFRPSWGLNWNHERKIPAGSRAVSPADKLLMTLTKAHNATIGAPHFLVPELEECENPGAVWEC
ncbi:hypothetical protein PoB_005052400 [Plakobranchus ocellatus]|uniref:Uncharacterized protein n=1 Tax=Plakobranchus ocellatus TaxID=259542 RepID=A0AAV4BUZ5_9GAST|nr:hypothetical protein PoB_005052400 [Plakobranchus ocellatus]